MHPVLEIYVGRSIVRRAVTSDLHFADALLALPARDAFFSVSCSVRLLRALRNRCVNLVLAIDKLGSSVVEVALRIHSTTGILEAHGTCLGQHQWLEVAGPSLVVCLNILLADVSFISHA